MIINSLHSNCGKVKFIQFEQYIVRGIEFMTFSIGLFVFGCDVQFATILRVLDLSKSIFLTRESID